MNFHSGMGIEGMDTGVSASLDGAKNGRQKPFWKYAPDGTLRKKKKPTLAQKNQRVKKFVTPRNAVVCLNDLEPKATYVTEQIQQPGAHGSLPFAVTVEANGQKFRGYGSSKLMAKQAAAEAALVSFVKPPAPPSTEKETSDDTPWQTLASFAMFKLFSEWRDGRYGGIPEANSNQNAAIAQTLQQILKHQTPKAAQPAAPIPMETQSGTDANAKPKAAKQLPANAMATHPVMLLHQMRPEIHYTQSSVIGPQGNTSFTVSAVIDGHSFSGCATNVKKAKYELALQANRALFGVVTSYVGNN